MTPRSAMGWQYLQVAPPPRPPTRKTHRGTAGYLFAIRAYLRWAFVVLVGGEAVAVLLIALWLSIETDVYVRSGQAEQAARQLASDAGRGPLHVVCLAEATRARCAVSLADGGHLQASCAPREGCVELREREAGAPWGDE